MIEHGFLKLGLRKQCYFAKNLVKLNNFSNLAVKLNYKYSSKIECYKRE